MNKWNFICLYVHPLIVVKFRKSCINNILLSSSLFVSLSLSASLSLSLSVSLSLSLSVSLCVSLSLSVYLSIHLSIYLYIYMAIRFIIFFKKSVNVSFNCNNSYNICPCVKYVKIECLFKRKTELEMWKCRCCKIIV